MLMMQRLPAPDHGPNAPIPLMLDTHPTPLSRLLNSPNASIRRSVLDAVDGLLRLQTIPADLPATLEAIAGHVLALSLPVDRLTFLVEGGVVGAEAVTASWSRRTDKPGPAIADSCLDVTGPADRWAEPGTLALAFGRAAFGQGGGGDGITQLLRISLPMAQGASGWLVLMTADPAGFTLAARAIVEALVPSIGALLAQRVDRLISGRLLRTYVGERTYRAISSGVTERGQANPIRSAILFADMRDSLGHTADIDPFQQIDLLNGFFDCLVPPIEVRGGEVLKFTGDGLLAIFPEEDDDDAVASQALAAARDAIGNLAALNAMRSDERPIELGIGLHYGEAAYGNVGSGLRLDFTVIGQNIGLASRIGGLNKALSEPLLMSSAFAERLREGGEPVGAFEVEGIRTPVSVLRPKSAPSAAAASPAPGRVQPIL